MDLMLAGLLEKAPWLMYVLTALGALAVVAQVVVTLTPSKKDDEFLEKGFVKQALEFFKGFAPIQKKPKK